MMRIYREMLGRFGALRGKATVIAYGSVASGKSRPDSDVDIAVISNELKAKSIADRIADSILFDYGKTVSVLHLKPSDVAEYAKSHFIKEVMKGEVLYGRGKDIKGAG